MREKQTAAESVCKGRKSLGGTDLAVAAVVLLHSFIVFALSLSLFLPLFLKLFVLWLLKRPAVCLIPACCPLCELG